ncbi:MAG TPA: phosphoribosylanthranilate isomerase [Thermoanaerobaculia bacterium]|nr:phosphoribosylanthranilate isomerase [Thermoanaerobaculia bacterium]
MSVQIKICGLTRSEDAVAAADLGADFLGMIFIPTSPRHIDGPQAAAIVGAVRKTNAKAKFVGVFRDASIDVMRDTAAAVGLDLIQMHGTETDEDIAAIGRPVIKTFRVGDALPDTTAVTKAEWVLFDTYDERREGGTGRRFDWSLLAMYPRTRPFLLAGGLNPGNVGAAISLVRPDAVDVASGVESEPGVKDHTLLKAFFERVRR